MECTKGVESCRETQRSVERLGIETAVGSKRGSEPKVKRNSCLNSETRPRERWSAKELLSPSIHTARHSKLYLASRKCNSLIHCIKWGLRTRRLLTAITTPVLVLSERKTIFFPAQNLPQARHAKKQTQSSPGYTGSYASHQTSLHTICVAKNPLPQTCNASTASLIWWASVHSVSRKNDFPLNSSRKRSHQRKSSFASLVIATHFLPFSCAPL